MCTIWYMWLVVLLGAAVVGWSLLADRLLVRRRLPPADDVGRFVAVDGVRTYYQVQGRGPALVLLHGLALSHRSWQAATPALAEHFTVYCLDLPGFGYSDKPAGYGSARREAAFVDRFLATLGVDHATVVGHSMGAAAALWLAVDHPCRVERLVVVNAAGIGPSALVFRVIGLPIVGELLLKTSTPASMRLLLAAAYVHRERVTRSLARLYTGFGWSPGARQALIAHTRAYDADRSALRGQLSQIEVPTLIVWTDRDPYFPLAIAHDLVGVLPNARLQIISGVGHLPQEERPAEFTGVLLGWAGSPPPPRDRPR